MTVFKPLIEIKALPDCLRYGLSVIKVVSGGKMNRTEMNIFQKTRHSIIEIGLMSTLSHKLVLRVWDRMSDFVFDYKYGAETKVSIPLSQLEISSKNKSYGVDYDPTNYFILKKIFAKLNLDNKDGNFVDFGAGKGRIMLFASQYGFRKIKGIEFSTQLCEVCENNISAYSKKTKTEVDFQVINMDAEIYEPDKNDVVFFFFNPFNNQVMESVLKNIDKSLKEHNRQIYLIYVIPVYAENFNRRYKQVCILKNIIETRVFTN